MILTVVFGIMTHNMVIFIHQNTSAKRYEVKNRYYLMENGINKWIEIKGERSCFYHQTTPVLRTFKLLKMWWITETITIAALEKASKSNRVHIIRKCQKWSKLKSRLCNTKNILWPLRQKVFYVLIINFGSGSGTHHPYTDLSFSNEFSYL